MKKTLLYLLISIPFFTEAQTLASENFNSLTIGNVGTDITGATAGQNSWFTLSSNGTGTTTSTNASNANFQISASGNSSSNGLLIQGPNGNNGARFMWKNGLPSAWSSRVTGNNIIEVEYSFYTGASTTSTVQSGVRLYGIDGTSDRVLCGYVYNSNTRLLQGVAYLDNAGTFGTFLITLQTGGLILNADTWYKIGFGYDTTTGEPYWKFNSNPSVSVNSANFSGPFTPTEVDFVMAAPTTNSASSNIIFDNYLAKAVSTDTLLENANFASTVDFSVYPNPSNDVVNISNSTNAIISTIEMTDLNGRVVKNVSLNATEGQVNISDLSTGVYMMNVSSDQGSITKKIIKN